MDLIIKVNMESDERLATYLRTLVNDQIPSIIELKQTAIKNVEKLLYSYDGHLRELEITIELDTKDELDVDVYKYGLIVSLEKYIESLDHVLGRWEERPYKTSRGTYYGATCVRCGEEFHADTRGYGHIDYCQHNTNQKGKRSVE